MSDKDLDLFLKEMADVRPIPADDRIQAPAQTLPEETAAARRAAAAAVVQDSNPLTLPEDVPQVGPHDVIGRRKNGVQEGVYRKLRLGKYEVQERLDLHRVTIRDARDQVYAFLARAGQKGLRTVLITHGKGFHSPTPARLKSYVIHWLEESELALAYHSAQPAHGGAGATYVMVRKSPEARQQTRERLQR